MPDFTKVRETTKAADARTGGILLSKVEAAQKVMLQKGVSPDEQWQVELLIDASGSMDRWYANGSVQATVERVLAFAMNVDPDGRVSVVTFGEYPSGGIKRYEVDQHNYHGFVRNNGIDAYGGTPMTEAIYEAAKLAGHGDLFEGDFMSHVPTIRPSREATLVVTVCDGEPSNEDTCRQAICAASYRAIMFKKLFVGNNTHGWKFLKGLDDKIRVGKPFPKGRVFDNVDAQKVDLETNDGEFYNLMLDELSDARAAMRKHGLLV